MRSRGLSGGARLGRLSRGENTPRRRRRQPRRRGGANVASFVRTDDTHIEAGITVTSDPHLCNRCRHVHFQDIFGLNGTTLAGPASGRDAAPAPAVLASRVVFELGHISASDAQSACKLCRILGAMVRASRACQQPSPPLRGGLASDSEKGDSNFDFRAYSRSYFWHLSRNTEVDAADKQIVLALAESLNDAVGARRGTRQSHREWQEKIKERGVIQRLPNGASFTSAGIRDLPQEGYPVPDYFPPNKVRDMIGACYQSHSQCQPTATMHFPAQAEVIDCEKRRVVSLEKGMEYLALSYVYGREHADDGQNRLNSGYLPRRLPQVVQDAMDVTMDLRFRYLWVDAYCISFNSRRRGREYQLSQMGNIYHCAIATICAIGRNDSTPIPGVSIPRTRETFSAQGETYQWVGRELRTFVKQSAWHTRAWTLQELVLSRRCLFFTESEVVMACRTGVFHENVALEKTILRQAITSFDRESWLLEDGSLMSSYLSHTRRFHMLQTQYSKRHLRRPEDALNAFQAIIAQLVEPSYWGVVAFDQRRNRNETPVRFKTELAFIHGLSWIVLKPHHNARRKFRKLPSWSWITQTTPAEYKTDAMGLVPGDNHFHAKIAIATPEDDFTELAIYFNMYRDSPKSKNFPTLLQVKSVHAKWCKVRKDARNLAELSDTSNAEWLPFLEHNVGDLYLDETSSSFPLPASCGQAILLSITKRRFWFSRWLLVSKEADETWTRQGLLIWPSVFRKLGTKLDGMNARPPEDARSTFYVG